MGFKCASFIVDFFLYLYEADFIQGNHISGVMVTRLASSVVDREFEDQTKDYKIAICCFSAKRFRELFSRIKGGFLYKIRFVSS
jgi:hypothetical protein